MTGPQERQERYQAALAWVAQQVAAAERQELTLNYLGGWHTFKPDPKMLERAWRVLYGIPDAMTHLLTSPEMPWALVMWRWERHQTGSGP